MQTSFCDVCFVLQIDFNLLGMGHLKLSKVLFRDPVPDNARQHSQQSGWPAEVSMIQFEDEQLASGGWVHSGSGGSGNGSNATGSRPTRSVVWTRHFIPSQWLWSDTDTSARYAH